MDWIVRVDVILLGLMLTYVIGLWIRGVYICCSQHNKSRSAPGKLNFGAKTLHSILAVAPFLGLAAASAFSKCSGDSLGRCTQFV